MNRNQQEPEDYTKKYPKPILTVFQQKRMKEALENHRSNITAPQICMNKVFKGKAFISKPEIIEFKDFNVNEPHIKIITLTNVSNTFCSFKLKPIQDEYRDFFEIEYRPPGRMSAGISCKIKIKFTPDINKDIDTFLPILAQTGLIEVPIKCTYKKAIVREEKIVIDFGDVIFGEEGTVHIVLKNEGALDTLYYVKNARGELMKEKTETMSNYSRGNTNKTESARNGEMDYHHDSSDFHVLNQLFFMKTGRAKGYSALKIPVTYRPTETGEWETFINFHFENFIHSPSIEFTLRGKCVDLPIYIEKEVYDLEICLLKHMYREQLVFHNRGKKAMKVQMILPLEAKKFISLNPSFGYIQAQSPLKMWLKLKIIPSFLLMCKKYQDQNHPGLYRIPLKLIGSEQKLPVEFTLCLQITTNQIKLQPDFVDFGLLYENIGKKVNVKFENTSDLPQEIYFYPLPRAVTFEPMQVPIKVLPKETTEVSFIYRGHEVKKEEGILRAKIVTGTIAVNQVKFGYKAEVFKCPLKFNPLKIEFPALQVGEKNSHIMSLRNFSSKAYVCEFFLPYLEVCGLKLTPMCFKLKPGKAIEVNLEYHSQMKKIGAFSLESLNKKYLEDPNQNFDARMKMVEERKKKQAEEEKEETSEDRKKKKLEAMKKPPAQKKKSKKEIEQEEEDRILQEEQDKLRAEEEIKQRELAEARFNVNDALAELGGKFHEFSDVKNQSQHYKWLVPCFFRPINEPETSRTAVYIEIDTVSTSKVLISDRSEINFGEIAVGFRKIEELLITNRGEKIAHLRMDLLPLFGGFHVLNALRSIPPGKTKNIVIQFEPHNQQEFKETLRIFCKESSISVKLRGRSVKPEVVINPESGILDVSGCLPDSYIIKKFVIKNISNFGLEFRLDTLASGIKNKNGQEAFIYTPSEGRIKASEEQEIEVKFRPDRVSEKYWNLIKIDVPNQKNEKQIYIYGSCYPRQAFIIPWEKVIERPTLEMLNNKVEMPLDFIRIEDSENVIGYQVKELNAKFEKEKDDKEKNTQACYEQKIIIGACKMLDPKLEKGVSYDLQIMKDENSGYFTCSSTKGSVTAGNELEIVFNFKPPEIDPFIANIEAFKGIGQWIEVKGELKLSGGYLPPVEPGTTPYNDQILIKIHLKAYIKKI